MSYTSSQLEAISTINNNLQIIACAGSGIRAKFWRHAGALIIKALNECKLS